MADTLGLGSNPLNRVGVQVHFSIVDNYVFMKISTINFFVALKNASVSNKGIINIKANQEIIPILQCLYEQGFILSFNYVKSQKVIVVVFKKESGLNFFTNLKCVKSN